MMQNYHHKKINDFRYRVYMECEMSTQNLNNTNLDGCIQEHMTYTYYFSLK